MANELIIEMTKDCPFDNCSVQQLATSSTLMSWATVYDKQGNQTSKDPNVVTTDFWCHVCGSAWKVKTQYGMTTIVQTEKPEPICKDHKE